MPKKSKKITDEEIAKRRLAWEHANASILIEGGSITEETLEMQERHINGDLTFEEYFAWAGSIWNQACQLPVTSSCERQIPTGRPADQGHADPIRRPSSLPY